MGERTEYNKIYMRKRRLLLSNKGICPVCGKRPKMKDKSRCIYCYTQQKNYREKIREILNNVRK